MRGLDRHGVHHGVYGHAGQPLLFLEAYAQLVEGLDQLRIHLVHRLLQRLLFRRGIVADGLEIDWRYVQMRPRGRRQRLPVAERLETEFQQPLRLLLDGRYAAYHILVKARRHYLSVDVGRKTIFIFRVGGFVKNAPRLVVHVCTHGYIRDYYAISPTLRSFAQGLHNLYAKLQKKVEV